MCLLAGRTAPAVCNLAPCFYVFTYALQEATEALKPILGEYYCSDKRNVLQALWHEISICHYVAPERDGSGVLWFATHTKDDVVSATAAAAAGFNAAKAAKAA
jgi:omega-6 fatty acid desaturase (delta-12 desaturase)